jgi:hypothetical protein
VGQPVTFTSTSAAGTGNAITSQLWDLDDDGKFDDAKGRKATKTFTTSGNHVVTLRVVDSHAAHNHVHAETVTVLALNQPPMASFAYTPSSPITGQPVSFYSTATDPDTPIAVQRWDLDGNGSYGDVVASNATVSFPTPGPYNIGLQVEDTAGAVSTAVGAVTVLGAASAAAPPPLFPSPVIRLSGTIRRTGIRVRRLTIDAPPGFPDRRALPRPPLPLHLAAVHAPRGDSPANRARPQPRRPRPAQRDQATGVRHAR